MVALVTCYATSKNPQYFEPKTAKVTTKVTLKEPAIKFAAER